MGHPIPTNIYPRSDKKREKTLEGHTATKHEKNQNKDHKSNMTKDL